VDSPNILEVVVLVVIHLVHSRLIQVMYFDDEMAWK